MVSTRITVRAASIGGLILAVTLGCTEDTTPVKSQLSEKPDGEAAIARMQPGSSEIGLRLRTGYQDLEALLAKEVPEVSTGDGRKRVCKRVIGVKVCGTANWQYTATRTDDISVSGDADRVRFGVPIRFDGSAGVEGGLAKALGLGDLEFFGAVEATIGLQLDLADDWCPVINTEVDYRWSEAPKARWAGGIDIGIQSKLDEAIDKQLAGIDEKIKESIDCETFRTQLAEQWREYSFPLEIPMTQQAPVSVAGGVDSNADETQTDQDSTGSFGTDSSDSSQLLYLNLKPQGFRFSGIRTEEERLGVSFVLTAETTVDDVPLEQNPLLLPAVERTDYRMGSASFELPVQVPYRHLEAITRAELTGREFKSGSDSTEVTVVVHDVEFYGSEQGMTIGIEFEADLPATVRNTLGTVFLTTQPVVDPFNRTLSLTNTSMSRVLDSTLWSLLTAVFEDRIISSIEDKTVIELGDQLDKLELRLMDQLSSTERTGGLHVTANELRVNLTDIVPQTDDLVLRLEVAARMDIDVPASIVSAD